MSDRIKHLAALAEAVAEELAEAPTLSPTQAGDLKSVCRSFGEILYHLQDYDGQETRLKEFLGEAEGKVMGQLMAAFEPGDIETHTPRKALIGEVAEAMDYDMGQLWYHFIVGVTRLL